jgi:hypothetical protein
MIEPQGDIAGAARASAKQGRAPLTLEEILELDAALVQAFRTIETLRTQHLAARHIKFPPMPSIFTESIVIASAARLFGPGWNAKFGSTECDVLIQNDRGEVKRVEVKATGEHNFQEFKAKDLRADILLWIRFGRRFKDGAGAIEVAMLEEPSRFIDGPCRLDRTRFSQRIGKTDCLQMLSFESLEELLGVVPRAH